MMMKMRRVSCSSFQLASALLMLNSVLLIQANVSVLLRESQVATAMSKFLLIFFPRPLTGKGHCYRDEFVIARA